MNREIGLRCLPARLGNRTGSLVILLELFSRGPAPPSSSKWLKDFIVGLETRPETPFWAIS